MNGLLLWGKVGTGKSFYASAIANRVIDLGFSALQTSVQDIVTHIESVPFNERENAKSRLLKYDLGRPQKGKTRSGWQMPPPAGLPSLLQLIKQKGLTR